MELGLFSLYAKSRIIKWDIKNFKHKANAEPQRMDDSEKEDANNGEE